MYKLLLCWRYLRTRWIALASVISVMLGVATMIVVNSVMAGFSYEMRDRIRGLLSDVEVESLGGYEGFRDADGLMARIREICGDDVAAMSPVVQVFGMLNFQWDGQWVTRPVTVIGVDPESRRQVGDYAEHLMDPRNQREPGFEVFPDVLEYRARQVAMRESVVPELFERPPQERPQANPPFGEALTGDDAGPSLPANPFDAPAALPDNPFDQPGADVPDPAEPLHFRVVIGYALATYHYTDAAGRGRDIALVRPGDDVKITVPTAGRPPRAVDFNATVVDYFRSNMSEYDSTFVFMPIEQVQELRGMLDPATGARSVTAIQIRVADGVDPDDVVRRLQAALPYGRYAVHTWEEKQGPLLAAVSIEQMILNVLLFLIVAVAGFGILAIFFMIVVEKTRDIGILKSLGASDRGVMGIFLSYGLTLGLVGSGIGLVLGLVFVWQINAIEDFLTWATGLEVFPDTIYYFPEIPTRVEPWTVLWIAVGAIAIAVLASILPARRAARLRPVEALRYE